MCIALLTTSHPSYALILLDNRDEFILRPTSRPTWLPTGATTVLASRDLQRAEKGTWLGITPQGTLAVLTNYRETDSNDAAHPVHAVRSRGGMVTYWLGTDPNETTRESVGRLVGEGGVKGVGGFSMLCGKLRRRGGDIEPLAIVSNRSEGGKDVPWVCGERGEVCALSNTCYGDDEGWPKLENGKRLLAEAVASAVEEGVGEEELTERLFGVLDTDTLIRNPDTSFEEAINSLKNSIFIPPLGDESHRKEMEECKRRGRTGWPKAEDEAVEVAAAMGEKVAGNMGFATGMYGTQRQTVVLVDWEGNVVFRERALFDGNGNKVGRGEGDEVFRFKVEGWEA